MTNKMQAYMGAVLFFSPLAGFIFQLSFLLQEVGSGIYPILSLLFMVDTATALYFAFVYRWKFLKCVEEKEYEGGKKSLTFSIIAFSFMAGVGLFNMGVDAYNFATVKLVLDSTAFVACVLISCVFSAILYEEVNSRLS